MKRTRLQMHPTFSAESIHRYCDQLIALDPVLQAIIDQYGYPKIYFREPGFSAMVRLILEQQVSLLSAKAAWNKLVEKIGDVSAEAMLQMSDDELRACYFSRQKATYVRILAQAVVDGEIIFSALTGLGDDDVKKSLVKIKGIGTWTAESYLLLSLNRLDIFPIGDIALVNSIRKHLHLDPQSSRDDIVRISERWRPYRSIATLIFWHAYIIDRKILL